MNKYFKQTITILLLIIVIFSLFGACEKEQPNTNSELKQIKIIIDDISYEVSTNKAFLHNALVDLKNEGKITYEYTEMSFGVMVDKIGNTVNDNANNKYISLFHNIDKIEYIDYSPEPFKKEPILIEGVTYKYSSVGVSTMPVIDEGAYLFVLS